MSDAVQAEAPPAGRRPLFSDGYKSAVLPKIALGEDVKIRCDGCKNDIPARITFISRSSEFTPPVIYSLEERSKLVYLVEARTQTPENLRVGQPVSVFLPEAKR